MVVIIISEGLVFARIELSVQVEVSKCFFFFFCRKESNSPEFIIINVLKFTMVTSFRKVVN